MGEKFSWCSPIIICFQSAFGYGTIQNFLGNLVGYEDIQELSSAKALIVPGEWI